MMSIFLFVLWERQSFKSTSIKYLSASIKYLKAAKIHWVQEENEKKFEFQSGEKIEIQKCPS